MQLTLFWIFSLLMIGFGVCVILLRNPVACALSLVASFIALAALFVTLDAYFIAIIQILVTAGAVMVLFLFIIMLLNLKGEERRRIKLGAMLGGGLVVGCFVELLSSTLSTNSLFAQPLPPLADSLQSDVAMMGSTLFHSFNLPFQIIGVLLLVATVGVVVLSRQTLK
jgi:NADH-quinone oxidoreductase subunit J